MHAAHPGLFLLWDQAKMCRYRRGQAFFPGKDIELVRGQISRSWIFIVRKILNLYYRCKVTKHNDLKCDCFANSYISQRSHLNLQSVCSQTTKKNLLNIGNIIVSRKKKS